MRLARETIINFVGALGKSVAGFFGTVIIARFLGAEALGTYALVIALLFWLDIPVTGIQIAVMKRVSEGAERATYFTTGLAVNLCIVVLMGAGIILARDSVHAYVGAYIAPLLVLLFGANVVFGNVMSGLQAQKQVGLSGLLRAFERVFRTLFQLAMILLSYTIGGLVAGHAASLLLTVIVSFWFYRFGFAPPQLKHLRDLLSYAKYAWASQLKGKAYGWLDTIVLGFYVSASFIGIYEVAWSLASVLVLINNSISETLFPEVSDLNKKENQRQIRAHINEAISFFGIVMFPGFVGALILGPDLMRIYGSEFTTGRTVLLILIFARMANSVAEVFYSTIFALDRPDIGFRIVIPVMGTNLVLNFMLVSMIGWHGAAIATAATGTINLLLCYATVEYLIGDLKLPTTEIGKQLVACFVMGGIVWILNTVISGSSIPITIGLVMAGAIVYTSVLIGISLRFRRKLFGVMKSF
jgi:O-antigen/teichoic acid export membrane protein